MKLLSFLYIKKLASLNKIVEKLLKIEKKVIIITENINLIKIRFR